MARPRLFNEEEVLDAAMRCFWSRGFNATSLRELVTETGLTGASLYNAFGNKRALYQRVLGRYLANSVHDRIHRCEKLPAVEAIETFFSEIIQRSLNDPDCKGCMLVNAALEITPQNPELQSVVQAELAKIGTFFRQQVDVGQKDGTINSTLSAESLGHHLLGVLMGLRVLARVQPDETLFNGIVRSVLTLLKPQG
ncbi:TetR/AcrR family transcriptional regulator [Halomonas sp. AOP13-D3-9]